MKNNHSGSLVQLQEVLRKDLPLSVVLGGGGVRGLAHLGVLEVLSEQGFQLAEIVGTSVGALILTYYAAVGLDVPTMRKLGLGMSSRHLLGWAFLRRFSPPIQHRFRRLAGIIPEYLDRLSNLPGDRLFHGVERIGLVAYDLEHREEIVFHNLQQELLLNDALRGAVAIPGIFPPRECLAGSRKLRLIDGGVTNKLPVDKLFSEPFQPAQILVVDISNRIEHRQENSLKINQLQAQFPQIPIVTVTPDTLGKATVLYRTNGLESLIESGKIVTQRLLKETGSLF